MKLYWAFFGKYIFAIGPIFIFVNGQILNKQCSHPSGHTDYTTQHQRTHVITFDPLSIIYMIDNLLSSSCKREGFTHQPSASAKWISRAMWPEVVKFGLFGKIFKVWCNFWCVYLLFSKILNLLCQIFYTFGQTFIDVNGQMLKNNLAIWSHWRREGHVSLYLKEWSLIYRHKAL